MDRLDSSQLKALYDANYARRLDSRDHAGRLRRLVGKADLRESYDVVDFACGNGALLDVVFSRVRTYTGVDFAPDFIEIANARKDKLEARNASFYCMSIGEFCSTHNGLFDAAFAFDFSEHVYDEEWVDILKQIRSSLRPSGTLYVHTPNAEFILELLKSRNCILKQSREHIAVRSAEGNARLLEKAGYRIGRTELVPHYNVLRFIHPLSYLPVVGRYLKARIFIAALAT